jgi:hypothetical protein
MNSFQIKILACLLMFIDHIGWIFFPQIIFLRLIGRLSFPLFAFLLTEGFRHTRNVEKYLMRLAIFACLSQPIYYYVELVQHQQTYNLNIFFALFLGLSAIYLYNSIGNKNLGFIVILVISVISEWTSVDYGFYGIFIIFFFWLYNVKKDPKSLIIAQVLVTLVAIIYSVSHNLMFDKPINDWLFVKVYALFSIPIVMFYNGQLGPKLKYLFYVFYPAHLLILVLIKQFIK